MLDKLKDLFTNKRSHAELPLSDQFQHPQINNKDASQCPFMKKQSKEHSQASKCPVSGKEAQKAASTDSDSEEEKPRGGCPFMGTSNKKKNPDLPLKETGHDQPFVSKYKYYLSHSKIDFSIVKNGPRPIVNRQVFNSYPIYLQHTLFFNGEDYKKVRNMECCSRFMAYQQLREKGNKRFNKGRYYEALQFYERAASLFRWLEYYQPVNESTISSQYVNSNLEQSFDQISENGSKINIDLQEEKAKVDQGAAVFEELKTKYKEFFITYSDENTRLFDGEEMAETADIDMRKSLLIQSYLNMCAAYINTHHYSLAVKVCEEGLSLSDNVSQLYFRKAQALSLNKDASIQQLNLAFQLINKAIQRRAQQKIFSSANENILKMLNLQNSAEAYEGCRQYIVARISEVTSQNTVNSQKIYNRTKQIHEIQQKILAEGKVPRERNDEPVLYNTTEMKILNRMATKYLRVIQFYTEAKNYEQVNLAKKQFQQILRIKKEVKDFFQVQLKEKDRELGGLETQKIKARVAYVKTAFAENVYNSGRFNFTMLEWAIKQIVKEQAEQKKKILQASKNVETEAANAGNVKMEGKRDLTKLAYLLLLVPLFGILFNMFAL